MAEERYLDEVLGLEAHLGEFAFKSSESGQTLEGKEALSSLDPEWSTTDGRARLRGRTPVTLERDRILFSDEYRRQDDKHHVLFVDTERVVRNYTSQAVRCAHVARAVAGRLNLNTELAEAIAYGSKVGGVPFLHVGRDTVDDWVRRHIKELDTHAADRTEEAVQTRLELHGDIGGDGEELTLPSWISTLQSPSVKARVEQVMPWAAGLEGLSAYGSGAQSYWHLTLNPFLMQSRSESSQNLAQTMYGIWRHSLVSISTDKFLHTIKPNRSNMRTIASRHLTHEAVVVRYADDITWAIENLSEASRAAMRAGRNTTAFHDLSRRGSELPGALQAALSLEDPGRVYTYFIDDLVASSRKNFSAADRNEAPRETNQLVTLSNDAHNALSILKTHLDDFVFLEDRIKRRNDALDAITRTTLDILYGAKDTILTQHVKQRAQAEGWHSAAEITRATTNLADPVNRIQACVSLFVAMSDRQVYDFIGLGE